MYNACIPITAPKTATTSAPQPFRYRSILVATRHCLSLLSSTNVNDALSVGVEHSTFPYDAAKRTAETLVAQAGLPWSILRATQFHTFARGIIQSRGADTTAEVVAPAGVRLQSIDSGEVAGRLVALAEMGPLGHIAAMGGPEILTIEEMTTAYLQARGRAATVRSEPLSDALYDALRSGDQLTPDHAYGLLTWHDFLRRTSLSVPRSS